MNLQHFKNSWKYHYKKYLALFFTIAALILLLGAGAYDVYLSYGQATGSVPIVDDFLTIWDFALFAIAHMFIFFGNGPLAIQALASGEPKIIVLYLLVLLCDAGVVVTGIMTYIRTSQYLRNTYANYIGLRTWCLLFVIFNALLYGFEPAYLVVASKNFSVLLLVLEPLSQVFISLAIFFTVTRIKTEY